MESRRAALANASEGPDEGAFGCEGYFHLIVVMSGFSLLYRTS
jgi:hypothetical protein